MQQTAKYAETFPAKYITQLICDWISKWENLGREKMWYLLHRYVFSRSN